MSSQRLRIGLRVAPQHCTYDADARDVAARRGRGRGHPLHLGSLLPAVRRSRRVAFRVLEPAGRDGGGHGAHPLRRARDLQLLPQPEPARRHGAHRRPHLRWAPDPGAGLGLVRARLRRVRLRVRHGDHAAAGVSHGSLRDRRAPRAAQPATRARQDPGPDRRRRREGDAAAGRAVGRYLARLRSARGDRPQVPRAGRALRRDRPRPGQDRALGAGHERGHRDRPARPLLRGRRAGTSSRSPRSPTSTSPICGGCSPGATR